MRSDDRTFDDFTDDQVIDTILDAVKTEDRDIATALLKMLAIRNPDRVEELVSAVDLATLLLKADPSA